MKFNFIILNKKTILIITNICIFLLIALLLFNSQIILSSITISTKLFVTKLVPSLFIYLLITELLINSNKICDLSYGVSKVISKIFRIPTHTTSAVIIGFLLGYPNSAKYILKLYESNNISTKTCEKLVSFTSNANMSYIIATIGISMYNNVSIGVVLLISHFLSAIIIGILYTPASSTNIIQQTNANSNSPNKIYTSFELLLVSIYGTLKTLGNIFAFTIIFSLIPSIITQMFNLPEIIQGVLLGVFEISNGVNKISSLNISLNLKLICTSFTLSFSSLMIITQIYSFVYKTKIKFSKLMLFKFIQGMLSSCITHIILNYIYSPVLPANISIDKYSFATLVFPSTVYMLCTAFTILVLFITYKKNDKF